MLRWPRGPRPALPPDPPVQWMGRAVASVSDPAGLPLPSLRLFKLKQRYRNVLDTRFELLPRMAR